MPEARSSRVRPAAVSPTTSSANGMKMATASTTKLFPVLVYPASTAMLIIAATGPLVIRRHSANDTTTEPENSTTDTGAINRQASRPVRSDRRPTSQGSSGGYWLGAPTLNTSDDDHVCE